MTPTPPTNNGRVLERIMGALNKAEIPIQTQQYNRMWSEVLRILDEEYDEPEAS